VRLEGLGKLKKIKFTSSVLGPGEKCGAYEVRRLKTGTITRAVNREEDGIVT
jgi:hypothetical protein